MTIGVLRAHGEPSAHVLDASDLIPLNREYADGRILPHWTRVSAGAERMRKTEDPVDRAPVLRPARLPSAPPGGVVRARKTRGDRVEGAGLTSSPARDPLAWAA